MEGIDLLVEGLSGMHEALGSVHLINLALQLHTYDPNIQETEAGKSQIQGHRQLHRKVEATWVRDRVLKILGICNFNVLH